jgi:hypothetical protein
VLSEINVRATMRNRLGEDMEYYTRLAKKEGEAEGITGPGGLVFPCVREDEANIERRAGPPSSTIGAGFPSL